MLSARSFAAVVEQHDDAQRRFSLALEAYSAIGDGCGAGRSTAALGIVAFFRGDLPRATGLLQQALATLTAEGDRWGQGLCHTYLGLTAKQSRNMPAAEQHLLAGIGLLAQLRDVAILGRALAALAAVELTRAPRRALVLAAAATARSGAGGRYADRAQGDIDAVRAAATTVVGADKAAAVWLEGSRLLLGEAAAFALGSPLGRTIAAPGGLSSRE